MCVILYKPENIKMPKKEILENCFRNNPDGAGIMYRKDNKIIIRKGLMKFDEYWCILEKAQKIIGENAPIISHFRIGTHGKKVHKNFTHPFPITDDIKYLYGNYVACESAIVHNGIISNFGTKNLSDTMEFVQKILTPLYNARVNFNSDSIKQLIQNLIATDKMIIWDMNKIVLIGNFIQYENCYFSNTSYLDKFSFYNDYFLDNEKRYTEEFIKEFELKQLANGKKIYLESGIVINTHDDMYYYDTVDHALYEKTLDGKIEFLDYVETETFKKAKNTFKGIYGNYGGDDYDY